MGNFIKWLFTDPATEGATTPSGNPTYFNAAPWLIVLGILLLLVFYYNVEGRKKIPWIKDHTIWKNVLDRMTAQLAWLIAVGFLVVGLRIALDYTLFAWRIWQIALIGWGVGIAIYWLNYFVRHHNRQIVAYQRQVVRAKYLPKRRTASAR